MVEESSTSANEGAPAQVTHRLKMSPAMFRALARAQYKLAAKELETCSPRKVVTYALTHPRRAIFQLCYNALDKACQPDKLVGNVKLNLRLDSPVNDLLREFREHAEQQLGRPVSVLEAIYACISITGNM